MLTYLVVSDIPTVIIMLSCDSSSLPKHAAAHLMLRGRELESSKWSENEQSHSIGTVSMTQLHFLLFNSFYKKNSHLES